MSKPARVYISGPISDRPKDEYMEHFKSVEKKLQKAGYWTFNPAEANKNMPPWFKHDDFMEVCRAELQLCDMICMLDGWKKSLGAVEELNWAEYYHIPAFTEDEI